ncbi:sodium-independent anion transporter [Lewinellaceae bacterium SD302]|nr:sodium-independent anion transporter [Lewinellaceae bacterium SD302]
MAKYFDFSHIRGDLTGGLVAGVIALPLALAFGVQSGLGAAAGLYGAIFVGIFAALFGGTETQASGPTGPMTVVSAALVTAVLEQTGSIESGLGIILLAFTLGGIVQIVFGLLNIAGYVKYFPYPVVSGFMSGVGLIIIILQIAPFVGLDSPKSTVKVIQDLPRIFSSINIQALGAGLLTVAVYFLFPLLTKKIPAALAALVVATVTVIVLGWDVPLIGEIPAGLPGLELSTIIGSLGQADWAMVLEYAVVLAVLGSIDSLLTSVIADNMTKTRHNSNRELIGQGIGNTLAGLFGGIPGAGSTKGTVVNINAGGKTRLSGTIHGLFLLAVLLGLGSLASRIPLAVLAGLLIPVGIKIIDFKGLKHLTKVPKSDAAVLVIVLLITTFGSLIQAVGVGLALASLLFMIKSGKSGEERLSSSDLEALEDEKPWQDELPFFEANKDRVLVKHISGPLFFGFTAYFKQQMELVKDPVRVVIIRMDRVPFIDQSGLYTLEDSILELELRNIQVFLVGLKEQPCDMLTSVDLIPDLVSPEHIFDHIAEAYVAARVVLVQPID